MYRADGGERKRLQKEEWIGIVRLAVLSAVLVLIMLALDWIAHDVKLSVLIALLAFVSLFGLTAGISFAVCSMIRSYRCMPFIRTAMAALFCLAFPVVLFTFGIVCFMLGIGPVPN